MPYGLGAAVVTPNDVFPISKDIHKAWLFLTPPPAPFLVVHASSTMQHLTWRTPVTIDNRLIQLRYGQNLFMVRPAVIAKAVEIAKRINDGQRWASPLLLDREASASYHGMLNSTASERMTPDEQQFFCSISAGERWALAYVMHSKLPQPEKPEAITEKVLSKFQPTDLMP